MAESEPDNVERAGCLIGALTLFIMLALLAGLYETGRPQTTPANLPVNEGNK